MKKPALLLLLLSAAPLFAGDKLINVQGKLTDSGGTPLTGNRIVTFRLYDVSTATVASALWSDTLTVTLSTGLFNVVLGQNTSLDSLAFDKTYYLGMQVSGDANEMSPRQTLAASLYALGSVGDFRTGKNLLVGGSVGVGTSTPSAKMELSGTTGVVLRLSKPTGASIQFSRSGVDGYQVDDNAGSIRFLSAGTTERLRVDPNGNVGIGTGSPSAKLEVSGTQGLVAKARSVENAFIVYSDDANGSFTNSANTVTLGATRMGTGSYPKLRLAGQGGMEFAVDGNSVRATIAANGTMQVAGDLYAQDVFQTSDARLKTAIVPLASGALDRLKGLQAVSYRWTDAYMDQQKKGMPTDQQAQLANDQEIGLLAQDVAAQYPELVKTWKFQGQDYYAVNYGKLSVVLLQAVKELSAQVDDLKQKLASQQK